MLDVSYDFLKAALCGECFLQPPFTLKCLLRISVGFICIGLFLFLMAVLFTLRNVVLLTTRSAGVTTVVIGAARVGVHRYCATDNTNANNDHNK